MANLGINSGIPLPKESSADMIKNQRIRKQLSILLHAQKCPAEPFRCLVPHCQVMRGVIEHMKTCNFGMNCQYSHCYASNKILNHWSNCLLDTCVICQPIKMTSFGNVFSLPPGAAGVAYQQMFPKSQQQPRLATTGFSIPQTYTNFPSIGKNIWDVTLEGNWENMPRMLPQYIYSSYEMEPEPIERPIGVPPLYQRKGSLPQTQQLPQPEPELQQKYDWRAYITKDIRDRLVSKMIHTICPHPSSEAIQDNRMNSIVSFARKVEGDLYNSAKSRDEYVSLFSSRTLYFQHKLEEKMKASQMTGQF